MTLCMTQGCPHPDECAATERGCVQLSQWLATREALVRHFLNPDISKDRSDYVNRPIHPRGS